MVTDEQLADILILNGLNWDKAEIADEVGLSESTVSTYVNQFESESKAAASWEQYGKEKLMRGLAQGFVSDLYGGG